MYIYRYVICCMHDSYIFLYDNIYIYIVYCIYKWEKHSVSGIETIEDTRANIPFWTPCDVEDICTKHAAKRHSFCRRRKLKAEAAGMFMTCWRWLDVIGALNSWVKSCEIMAWMAWHAWLPRLRQRWSWRKPHWKPHWGGLDRQARRAHGDGKAAEQIAVHGLAAVAIIFQILAIPSVGACPGAWRSEARWEILCGSGWHGIWSLGTWRLVSRWNGGHGCVQRSSGEPKGFDSFQRKWQV